MKLLDRDKIAYEMLNKKLLKHKKSQTWNKKQKNQPEKQKKNQARLK